MLEKIRNINLQFFGINDPKIYFAPGRVNLIGEHTDYNSGHVFPCALSLGTYGTLTKRSDSLLRFYSLNCEEEGICTVDLSDLKPGRTSLWTAYPEGVFWTMMKKGLKIDCGADVVYYGNVPSGSGLSSSASIEILTAFMIRDAYGFEEITDPELAVMCQLSENTYNEMKCGIMDQFSSAMGKKDHAIFLNTDTLEYQLVPLNLQDATILITNSKVKHSLVSSAYNDRRKECREALERFRQIEELKDLNGLCEMTCGQFERYAYVLEQEVLKKRARHAVFENARTLAAVSALKQNDLSAFGQLMNESHVSLRDDYEVSCEEIDFLTELAWGIPGVMGSRITGGGFGGCTVSILKKECVENFKTIISGKYKTRFGIEPDYYAAAPSDGAHKVC